jgi:hypothetical protein
MLKQAMARRGDEPAEQQLTQLESALELAGRLKRRRLAGSLECRTMVGRE